MNAKSPQSDSGRPPADPPTPTTLGGFGGEDDGWRDAFRTHLSVLRASGFQDSQDSQESLRALASLIQSAGSEYASQAISELYRQRADFVDQLELERLVARPPRKGYELIHPEDDRPTGIEREIALIDALLAQIDGPPA